MKSSKKAFKGYNLIEVIIIIIITSIISAITTGIIVNNNSRTTSGSTYSELLKDDNVKDFLNVYSSIMNGYYENVDQEAAMDSAINGLMSYLGDKYTTYLDTTDTDSLNSKLAGEYTGIGVSLAEDAIINEVFDDSPAQKGGLKVDDQIIAVNDTDVQEKTNSEIASLIKGTDASNIKITVLRNNEQYSYQIDIDTLYIPAITSKVYEQDNKQIGYIYISTFSSSLVDQVSNALTKLEAQKIDSLIIDLRGDGGGYLSSASGVASMFLEKGQTIYSLETKDNTTTTYDETDESRSYPIVVLIDSGSASASEILASSLKDSYNATLIGITSYGKGKVQQTYQLEDGSMVKYTSAKWLRPNGECIDGIGIIPDINIELEYTKDDAGNVTSYTDTQLNKALEVLTSK